MLVKLRGELEYRWRVVLIVALAVIGAAITLLASSLVAGVVTIVSGAVLTVALNPAAHSPPRPALSLVAVGETHFNPSVLAAEMFKAARGESDEKPKTGPSEAGPVVVGRRRPLDLEAVVTDGTRRARGRAPGQGPMANFIASISFPMQAKPTEADVKEFDRDVEAYAGRLRSWVTKIDEYLVERSVLLVADVQLENRAQVDADNARVLLRFPAGFDLADDLPKAEEPPTEPVFPVRPSPLAQSILSPISIAPHRRNEPMPVVSAPQLMSVPAAVWAPHYRQLANGEIEVDFNRQTIHHGESAKAGGPLIIASSQPGEHLVRWEIHAKNLPSARTGQFTVIHATEPIVGEPISSLGDLEAVLNDPRLEPR